MSFSEHSIEAVKVAGPVGTVAAGEETAARVREDGLTKESEISLRVWSDPTAKITLASGEVVTEL